MNVETAHTENIRIPEWIAYSAYRYNEEIFKARTHSRAEEKLLGKFPEAGKSRVSTWNAGFVTSEDRFVNREEARVIADNAGQLTEEGKMIRGPLASESLKFTEAVSAPGINCKGFILQAATYAEAWAIMERVNHQIRIDSADKPQYQGFITTEGRFATPEEALSIARKAGQIVAESDFTRAGVLTDQDTLRPYDDVMHIRPPDIK